MSLRAFCCTLVLQHFHRRVFMVTESTPSDAILKVIIRVWSRLGHKS